MTRRRSVEYVAPGAVDTTAPSTSRSSSRKPAAKAKPAAKGTARTATAARKPTAATAASQATRRLAAPARRRRPAARRARPPGRGANPRQRARRTIRANRRSLATRFSAGQPRKRLLTMLVVLLVVLGAVLMKVGLLQTFEGASLRSEAASQWTRERVVPAQRGAIFDRNGDELALSVPASTVAVNPKQVEDPASTAAAFESVLGLTSSRAGELERGMAARDRGFLYVARQIDTDVADRLDAMHLTGVTIYREDRRELPGGDTARSVIGLTNIDGAGIAGLEEEYDDTLSGEPGETTLEVAPDGRSIAGTEAVQTAPVAGNDVVLTIDRSVQYATERALLNQVAALRAEGAQAVVMDTKTGEIIAMASIALDDDGTYEVTSGNYSVVNAYEPGSVGKVITIAGALNEGVVAPDTYFTVPWQKVYTRAGDILHDSHVHGDDWMSVEDILVESSNIGTITVSEEMGFERQYHYMTDFGLGSKTALDFPGESVGILKPWQEWEGTEKYTVAYGQGVSSTPIQLISAVNTVANDGLYIEPKLVVGTVDGDGELHEADAADTHRVISEEAATQMQQMMKQVVCRGTAEAAQVPGLSVAGKTGTGYIAQPNGTYVRDDGSHAYYASFVGFIPAEDPQVTILVSIDQPDSSSDERFGGSAAAPVFRELAPTIVHERGIDPPLGSTGCEPE